MAAWIKMPLGMEVGLHPSDFVLDGDPAPTPQKGGGAPIFGPCPVWPNGWMEQDGIWHRWALVEATLCYMGTQLPFPKRGAAPSPISADFYSGNWYGGMASVQGTLC